MQFQHIGNSQTSIAYRPSQEPVVRGSLVVVTIVSTQRTRCNSNTSVILRYADLTVKMFVDKSTHTTTRLEYATSPVRYASRRTHVQFAK